MLIRPDNLGELKSCLAARPLVLFGLGGMGQKIAEFCDKNEIFVTCFVDNNAEKQKSERVISPEELKMKHSNANVVISSAIYFQEMKKQIELLGFPAEQIFSYKIFVADEITWRELDESANWERMKIRAKQLSEWIDGDVRSVVDYGAGEMFFRTLLSPQVEYFPIDYIRRSDDTILCDLNSGIFPDIHADVAILAGLLDIVNTAELLIKHVCATTNKKILTSYMTFDNFSDIEGRRASAYVNDYTESRFVELFERSGFVLKERQISRAHKVDTLFLFERS